MNEDDIISILKMRVDGLDKRVEQLESMAKNQTNINKGTLTILERLKENSHPHPLDDLEGGR